MDNPATPLAVVVFIGIAILSVVLRVLDARAKVGLRENGVTTTARVTARNHEVQHTPDPNDPNTTTTTENYAITYQYVVNGTTYTGRETVGQGTFEILREGQPVEVVYMRRNPAQVRLASSL